MCYAGDLDGELIADPLGLSGSDFNVTVQSDRAVVGRLPYHYIIKGLSNAMSYYVRLTAYNTLGTGIDITSEPALLKPAIQTPMIPQNVQATVMNFFQYRRFLGTASKYKQQLH